jgi:hypothetical protein
MAHWRVAAGLAAVLFLVSSLRAQPPETPGGADEAPLEEILVSGEFPGPGLWKVTRVDDPAGHVLWILGQPDHLPDRLSWKSKEVEALAVSSQEILSDAGVEITPDEKIGVFRGISLIPAVLKARRNPDDKTLKDLVPPELYARWQVQKKRYLGRESGIESWRPLFAADKLKEEAIEALRFRGGSVWNVLWPLINKHKIKVNSPMVRQTFKRGDLREKIKEFSREPLADIECFGQTLDLIDALEDRNSMAARARAWATADHESLARLPELPNPDLACGAALLNSQVADEIVPRDIEEQVIKLWLDTAQTSLEKNQTTLAVVPFEKLTRPGGYLARLREKGGYSIEPPK